jgi:hypothetical protein
VAAGVHDAVVDRREFQAGVFLDRQRVRIGTQDDAGDSNASWNVSDDSVTGDVGPILDGQPIEKFTDDGGGICFLSAQFGILMEHSSKLNETVSERFRDQRHDCNLGGERTTACGLTLRRVRPDRRSDDNWSMLA